LDICALPFTSFSLHRLHSVTWHKIYYLHNVCTENTLVTAKAGPDHHSGYQGRTASARASARPRTQTVTAAQADSDSESDSDLPVAVPGPRARHCHWHGTSESIHDH